jgi:hypothetical protein
MKLLKYIMFPNHMKRIAKTLLLAVAVAMAVSQASALTFQFNIEFSGGQAPGGPPPWLTATFTDGAADHVSLTLSASGLTGSENVTEWDFNVTDSFIGNLTFLKTSQVGTFTDPGILQSSNAFKADGDGNYDIEFLFATGSAAARFGAGESVTYDVSATGLTANDFNLLSEPAGGHGPFLSAAHIQNTTGAGTGGSGWIAPGGGNNVPDGGATACLLGLGLAGLGGLRARFGRK